MCFFILVHLKYLAIKVISRSVIISRRSISGGSTPTTVRCAGRPSRVGTPSPATCRSPTPRAEGGPSRRRRRGRQSPPTFSLMPSPNLSDVFKHDKQRFQELCLCFMVSKKSRPFFKSGFTIKIARDFLDIQ